jgi:hypothetical protein
VTTACSCPLVAFPYPSNMITSSYYICTPSTPPSSPVISMIRFKSAVTYHIDWERFFTPYIPPESIKPSPLRVFTVHFTPPSDPLPLHPVYKDSTDLTLVPNLELHSAAACGNIGLVHYALTHGQPVNSVLHGVLPLHAACSGGNVDVVKMLIERGANVNAPRLPRRYSDGRKSNAPSVGTAGMSLPVNQCRPLADVQDLHHSILPLRTVMRPLSRSC